jgi:hypothetical protein
VTADAAQAFLDSGGAASHPLDAANDSAVDTSDPVQAFLDSGGKTAHPLSKVEKAAKPEAPTGEEAEANNMGAGETVAALASGMLAKPISDIAGLAATAHDVLTGTKDGDPEGFRKSIQDALTYKPRSEAGQEGAAAVGNAMDATIGSAGRFVGSYYGGASRKLGAPDAVSDAIERGTNEATQQAPLIFGLKELPRLTRTGVPDVAADVAATRPKVTPAEPAPLTATGEPRSAPFEVNDAQAKTQLGIKPEKEEAQAGVSLADDEQQTARKDLFKRVGLKEVRASAVTGDAQAAADDFDATKYTGDPVGERLRGVIAKERQALADSTESIIDDAGGRVGTDQTTMKAKGKAMAAPVDAVRTYLDKATSDLYKQTSERFGANPVGQLDEVDSLLKNPDFTETLLAKDQGGLLNSMQRQFQRFKDLNPAGFTVDNAENFRKFLNQIWTPETSQTLGKVKGAIDEGVFKNAGADIYGPSRALSQTKKALLDDPEGMAIFDKDPNKPINRATAYEDIPNKVADLGSDQFNHLMEVYRGLPKELQPLGGAAEGEVQGHMVNRLLDAGSKTETQWNKKAVNAELSANSENFNTAFKNRPDLAARIKDIKDAGEALRFNSSYRGAHAQASNMGKSGIGKTAELAGAGAGAAAGTFVAGPWVGGPLGAAAGKSAVTKGLGALDARAATKAAESRVTKLD